MHDCGNGFFTYSADPGADNWTQDILLEGCYITACGNAGRVTEHDSYCESYRITYQYNHYGPPRGSDTQSIGNALKDRSAGMVVRYNWFDGGNRALDLVDAGGLHHPGGRARYQKTFVYGNVMIERNDAGNRQVVHFGGDMAGVYRPKGYFYNNTSCRSAPGPRLLFMATAADELRRLPQQRPLRERGRQHARDRQRLHGAGQHEPQLAQARLRAERQRRRHG